MKELKLFTIDSIEQAIVKVVAMEATDHKLDEKPKFTRQKNKKTTKSAAAPSKKNYFTHCGKSRHIQEKWWTLHPELRPNVEKWREKKTDYP